MWSKLRLSKWKTCSTISAKMFCHLLNYLIISLRIWPQNTLGDMSTSMRWHMRAVVIDLATPTGSVLLLLSTSVPSHAYSLRWHFIIYPPLLSSASRISFDLLLQIIAWRLPWAWAIASATRQGRPCISAHPMNIKYAAVRGLWRRDNVSAWLGSNVILH